MNDFPRTLLLTSWNPDGRYAGAEAMRRLLRALPRERILWCSLKAAAGSLVAAGMPEHRSCVAPALHWRLRNTVAGYVWNFDLMAWIGVHRLLRVFSWAKWEIGRMGEARRCPASSRWDFAGQAPA